MAAIAYTDIQTELGLTFATVDEGDKRPLQTEVTGMITGAANIFEANVGTAYDNTDKFDRQVIFDIVANKIDLWYWLKGSKAAVSHSSGGNSFSRSKPVIVTPDIQARMDSLVSNPVGNSSFDSQW